MSNLTIDDFFKRSENYINLIENIDSENFPLEVHSINYGAFLFSAMSIIQKYKKAVVLVENRDISKKIYSLFTSYNIESYELPEYDVVFFDSYSRSRDTEIQRLNALYNLIEKKNCVIIATPLSLSTPVMPMEKYTKKYIPITIGAQLNMEEFVRNLVFLGYERVSQVEVMSQFCVKGGIVDVFPPLCNDPVRIEFFGDEVDGMRIFHADTQVSFTNVNNITIRPAREGLIFEELLPKSVKHLKNLSVKSKNELLSNKYANLAERLEEFGFLDESYKYIPVFTKDYVLPLDYSQDFPVISWNFANVSAKYKNAYDAWIIRFKDHLQSAEALPEQFELMASYDDWTQSLSKSKLIAFDTFKSSLGIQKKNSIQYSFRDGTLYHRQIEGLVEDLKAYIAKQYTVLLFLTTENRVEGMKRLLADKNFSYSNFCESAGVEDISDKKINIINAAWGAGFISDESKLVVITEYEIYGETKAKRLKKDKNYKQIKVFTDINVGDYIVHHAHGIGKYMGVMQLKVGDEIKDYIKILYRNDDVLYVEVEKMELLQKYIGDDAKNVKLNKLGSVEWKNTKAKVKSAIEDMTAELIALYAKREQEKGFQFSVDDVWQKEFEDAFEHEETEDQLKAIEEIKRDMEKARPMDRLLCGDVGYGKTEVAIRAIFKAVSNSKQVAFLVPTTILAQQHYNTMQKRFASFPLRVEMMSRFRTKQQLDRIAEDIAAGAVDVVVGTHRILSKDVRFKDIGLLVIDEEQRFGVKHKEAIKALKTNIDVLTLSATPIPRTLHMSLLGIRDMSLIADPPEDRYPVQTYVTEYQNSIVADAILREISRGGQVFFVHNRVHDIDEVTNKLSQMLPEVRFEYAHGQMDEKRLEDLIIAFMNKEFDVLVSTSIIENGVDISNVNTIIIDEADKFGLSQLYQLRGRVGRSNRAAYAYMCYNKNKELSEISQKRLKAIKEFSDLGSGFKIAMRDLEFRGAGNLLGARQSGHLVSVGYEMYSQMIEEAISKLKGELPQEKSVDSSIDIKCSAYIPDNYISDYGFKLTVYKKISAIRKKMDKHDLESELFDRFGDMPDCVSNLISVGYMRAMSMDLGISDISEQGKKIVIKLSQNSMGAHLISVILAKYSTGKTTLRFITDKVNRFEVFFGNQIITKTQIINEIVKLLEDFVELRDEIKNDAIAI